MRTGASPAPCNMLKVIVFLASASTIVTERGEHKVHNLILNPEKHSYCQTTRIQQVVASPGYEPVTIDNNVCVGYCYSYSIPSTQPAEPGELIGPYCDSCQPIETKCYHVTLHADSKNTDGPKTFQKRVQIIKKCLCMSCEKIQREDCEITGQTTLELPQDLFFNQTQESTEEVPELLHFPDHPHKHPQILDFDVTNTTTEQRFELNSKLINLLKSIQSEGEDTNISYDKEQLKELLKIIEGSEKHQNIVHKNTDLGLAQTLKNNLQIEKDLKKYNLPKTFGLEESQIKHQHQHHLGDEMHVGLNVGHLIKGPHGSMVLAPDLKVEEKLNIDSDVLKPNHDGVVIAYENHAKSNGILTD